MAYPTGMLALTLEDVDRRAISVKTACQTLKAQCAAGNVNSSDILAMYNFLITQRQGFVTAAATPGIGAYAQAQKNSATLDVAAEFSAMLGAIDATTTWIHDNFPVDPSGFLLARTWGATGPVDRQFTPAQTAGFRATLDGVIASIA